MLPKILVVDDEIAASDYDITVFTDKYDLVKLGNTAKRTTVAEAVFCTGQSAEGENNYESVIKPAIEEGWGAGKRLVWALILLDVTFGKGNKRDDKFGEKVRELIARDFPGLPVVMLTAKRANELDLDKGKSVAYLSKSNKGGHRFKVTLARQGQLSDKQWRSLLKLPDSVIAESPVTRNIFIDAFEIAPTNAYVSLLGETGVGKTHIARYIHQMSPLSSNRELVEHNAADLEAADQALINIKLFGRRHGYPNPSDSAQKGIFEEANGSTLFLDEIGEISHQAQATILKVLEDKKVRREGTTVDIPTDFRLITGTLQDPEKLIAEGKFREDFYQRIQSIEITIPPLRERPEDILPMAQVFVDSAAQGANKSHISLSDEAAASLTSYIFPRNVRQLQKAIESIVARKGSGETISEDDIAAVLKSRGSAKPPSKLVDPSSDVAAERDTAQERNYEGTSLSLDNLSEHLANLPVSSNDAALKGSLPRLEKAVEGLKKKLAGAALLASKGTKSEPNLEAAWRHLHGINKRNNGDGAYAKRFFNKVLGRGRRSTPLSESDIDILTEACEGKKNQSE